MKKIFLIMPLVLSVSAHAGWTSPESMTPVKLDVIKEEIRSPSSHLPDYDLEDIKKKIESDE